MVVCKFFLQGSCRYGDRCWNEHPRAGQGQGDHSYGFSGGRQQQQSAKPFWGGGGEAGGNRFTPLQNQQPGTPSNANSSPQELLQVIAEDAGIWGRSKMWPFSCYQVRKDGPLLPGFEDLSPEELREEAYTAEKSGTFQSYVQKVSKMAAEYGAKRETLRQQGVETKQKLLQLIQEQEKQTSSSSSSTSMFGGLETSSGTFGQNVNQGGGLFNQSQNNSGGLFGKPPQQSTSVFGGQSTNSGLFGQNQTSTGTGFNQPTGSVFGGQPENKGLFGKPAATPNQATGAVFGQTDFGNQTQSTGGLFGKPQQPQQQPTTGGLFGKGPQSMTMTSQGQSGSIFGGNQSQQTGSVFGGTAQNPPQQNVFGSNQPQGSVFGPNAPVQSSQTTLFGKPQSQLSTDPHANLFKPTTQQTPVTQPAVTAQQHFPQTVPSASVISSIYTALEKLSREDKEQFVASKFTLGKIPMCPPPVELI